MESIGIAIILSLVVAIVIGTKLKINIGLIAIVFAYIFGVFFMGESVGVVIDLWPVRLFFQLFTITLFYAFAIQNGTLEGIARRMVYFARNSPKLIPIALWLVCFLLAAIGPGTATIMLIIPPILFKIGKETKMHVLLSATILSTGTHAGGWNPITLNGIFSRTLMESVGISAQDAEIYGMNMFLTVLIHRIILFAIFYFLFKGYKIQPVNVDKPEPFTKKQKWNVVLIVALLALLTLPAIFENLTGAAFFAMLRGNIDITFLAAILVIACILLKLGDFKKSITGGVAWDTILLICGTAMLIAVAQQAGAFTFISGLIGQHLSHNIAPYAVGVATGMIGMVTSVFVVIPAMYPLAQGVALVSGIDAGFLFSIVTTITVSAALSPFSLAGAMIMSTAENENERKILFFGLLKVAGFAIMVTMLLIVAGLVI